MKTMPVRPKRVRDDNNDNGSYLIVVVVLSIIIFGISTVALSLNSDKGFYENLYNISKGNVSALKSMNKSYSSYSNGLEDSNIILRSKISKLEKTILDNGAKHVKVTGYHPNSRGINSDSNPNMTATMTPHKSGYTCAISTALVESGWLGKEIYIDGFGMVLANDRLAVGIKGFQIDLCKGSYKDAMAVGENLNVLATLVSRDFIKQKLGEK